MLFSKHRSVCCLSVCMAWRVIDHLTSLKRFLDHGAHTSSFLTQYPCCHTNHQQWLLVVKSNVNLQPRSFGFESKLVLFVLCLLLFSAVCLPETKAEKHIVWDQIVHLWTSFDQVREPQTSMAWAWPLCLERCVLRQEDTALRAGLCTVLWVKYKHALWQWHSKWKHVLPHTHLKLTFLSIYSG